MDIFDAALKEYDKEVEQREKSEELHHNEKIKAFKTDIISLLNDIFEGHEEYLDLSKLKMIKPFLLFNDYKYTAEYTIKAKKYTIILLFELDEIREFLLEKRIITCTLTHLNGRFVAGSCTGREIKTFADIGKNLKILTENWRGFGYDTPF